MDAEGARGEWAWKGSGLRRVLLGEDDMGMLETCERKAEKEGTAIWARDERCLRCCCSAGTWEEGARE